MKLRYTDRAKNDVELAFAWYERQRRGLGFEFEKPKVAEEHVIECLNGFNC